MTVKNEVFKIRIDERTEFTPIGDLMTIYKLWVKSIPVLHHKRVKVHYEGSPRKSSMVVQ